MSETSEGNHSSYMVRLVFRHLAADERFARRYRKRAFARVSPDFAFFRASFAVFQRVNTYAHTQTTRKITVGGHVQMCVCARVCVWKKH